MQKHSEKRRSFSKVLGTAPNTWQAKRILRPRPWTSPAMVCRCTGRRLSAFASVRRSTNVLLQTTCQRMIYRLERLQDTNLGAHLRSNTLVAGLCLLLASCQTQPSSIQTERLIGPIPEAATRTFQTQSDRTRIDEYQMPQAQPEQPHITIRLEHLLARPEGSIDEQIWNYELKQAKDCQSPELKRIWSGSEAHHPSTVVLLTCPKMTLSDHGYLRLTKAIASQGTYLVTILLRVPAFESTEQLTHQEAVIFWVRQLKQFKVCNAPIESRTCPQD